MERFFHGNKAGNKFGNFDVDLCLRQFSSENKTFFDNPLLQSNTFRNFYANVLPL